MAPASIRTAITAGIPGLTGGLPGLVEGRSGASDPCARNKCPEQVPVNRVEDQGYHDEPHRLIDRHTRPVLFLQYFAARGKWFLERRCSTSGYGPKFGPKLARTSQYSMIRGERWGSESARNAELNTIQQHGPIHAHSSFKTGALNHSATLPASPVMREGATDCKHC
jgi:hypothetical protein